MLDITTDLYDVLIRKSGDKYFVCGGSIYLRQQGGIVYEIFSYGNGLKFIDVTNTCFAENDNNLFGSLRKILYHSSKDDPKKYFLSMIWLSNATEIFYDSKYLVADITETDKHGTVNRNLYCFEIETTKVIRYQHEFGLNIYTDIKINDILPNSFLTFNDFSDKCSAKLITAGTPFDITKMKSIKLLENNFITPRALIKAFEDNKLFCVVPDHQLSDVTIKAVDFVELQSELKSEF